MVSKVEVLEYLLRNDEVKYKTLYIAFGSTSVFQVVNNLVKSGFVEKFIVIEGETEFIPFLGFYREKREILLKPSERRRNTWLRLSKKAIKYVLKYKKGDKVSFLFTPMAEYNRRFLRRKEKKYLFEE